MTSATGTARKQPQLLVRRDFVAVRRLVRRTKANLRLADLCLFGRQNRTRVIDYLDRRECDRSRVEIPVFVTPAAFDGRYAEPLRDQYEILAVTRDVSRKGLGLMHDEPLGCDYAIVAIDLLDGQPASILLEVRWSNVEKDDMYMSGGRFYGIAEPG